MRNLFVLMFFVGVSMKSYALPDICGQLSSEQDTFTLTQTVDNQSQKIRLIVPADKPHLVETLHKIEDSKSVCLSVSWRKQNVAVISGVSSFEEAAGH